jgi:hypothetical protein
MKKKLVILREMRTTIEESSEEMCIFCRGARRKNVIGTMAHKDYYPVKPLLM